MISHGERIGDGGDVAVLGEEGRVEIVKVAVKGGDYIWGKKVREGSGEANRVVSDSRESCKIGKVGDRKVRVGAEIVEDNVCVAVGAEKVESGHEEIIREKV